MTSKVNPVPAGMTGVIPYLCVPKAAEALEFYKKAFGAEERYRMPSPDGQHIWHAEIALAGGVVMMSDELPEMGSKSPRTLGGVSGSMHLYVPDVDAFTARAEAEGCKVMMPPTDMFWGDRFAKVMDPFGHLWTVASHVRDVSPEEMKAAMEAMAKQGV